MDKIERKKMVNKQKNDRISLNIFKPTRNTNELNLPI